MNADRPNTAVDEHDSAISGRLRDDILARSPLSRLPPPSFAVVRSISRLERYSRRHYVFEQEQPTQCLLLVGRGRVRLDRTMGTEVVTLGHRGPGELLGEAALGGATLNTESALAVDETAVVALPLAMLRRLMASDPALRATLSAALVKSQTDLERRVESLLLHGVEARLALFLVEATRRWGEPAFGGGQLINATFTHAEIAVLIGSTRETVTLLLGKLRREGVVDLQRRRVVVRDADALRKRAATYPG